jgi:hypothetical protein
MIPTPTQAGIFTQTLEVIDAIASGGIENYEALDESGFVVAPLPFLDLHPLSHAVGSPNERKVCATSGIPPSTVSVSGKGSGSISNSNGDSAGEGLRSLRMGRSYWKCAPYG